MGRGNSWTVEELEILERNYVIRPIEEVMELLPNRTKDAIQWKAAKIGLKIRNGRESNASVKIIVNITQAQSDYLKDKRNHSRIIRDALDNYIGEESSQKREGKKHSSTKLSAEK